MGIIFHRILGGAAIAAALCGRSAAAEGDLAVPPRVLESLQRAWHFCHVQFERITPMDPGAAALTCLFGLKFTDDPEQKTVQRALAYAAGFADSMPDAEPYDRLRKREDVYRVALCAVCLIEFDRQRFRPQIDKLLRTLWACQKPHGGWGYVNDPVGDTSMVQYVALAAWEAHRAGIPVPHDRLERLAQWLVSTQDPSGQFGYHPRPSTSGRREPQDELRPSMTAAAAGSLYILLDLAGYRFRRGGGRAGPAVFQDDDAPAAGTGRLRVPIEPMRAAVEAADAWMDANFKVQPPGTVFWYYYLYTLERYFAFRYLVRGGPVPDAPDWYVQASEAVLASQQASGHWTGGNTPMPVDTAFAGLFLLRSTQRTLARPAVLAGGLLLGGRGLEQGAQEVRLRNGKVVARPLKGPGETLLTAVENAGDPDYAAAVEGLHELAEQADPATLSRHEARFRGLLSQPDPALRAAAVTALGRGGNLDSAPLLITALDDPEREVVVAANDALHRLARRLQVAPVPQPLDEPRRRLLIRDWKRWYLSVQPDAADQFAPQAGAER